MRFRSEDVAAESVRSQSRFFLTRAIARAWRSRFGALSRLRSFATGSGASSEMSSCGWLASNPTWFSTGRIWLLFGTPPQIATS